mgnify:FL=1
MYEFVKGQHMKFKFFMKHRICLYNRDFIFFLLEPCIENKYVHAAFSFVGLRPKYISINTRDDDLQHFQLFGILRNACMYNIVSYFVVHTYHLIKQNSSQLA